MERKMRTASDPSRAEFSLVRGGLLYRLMLSIGLAHPDRRNTRRTALVLIGVTWLPMLGLALVEGRAVGGIVLPFVRDYAIHARFLLSLPLLLAAEPLVDARLRAMIRHFTGAGIVREESRAGFGAAVRRAERLRDWIPAEVALASAALASGLLALRYGFTADVPSWQMTQVGPGGRATLAGLWYAIIANPIYLFLLYRWGWRFIIWSGLLWRISRLDLRLIAIHPDLAAGLGFLEVGQIAFASVVLAISVPVAAIAANAVVYEGQALRGLSTGLAIFAVVILVVVLGPLVIFAGRLIQAKRSGLIEYGALASDYTRSFDDKWVRHTHDPEEQILGSPDIQSLADLGGSFEVVRRMRVTPFGMQLVAVILLVALLPFLVLALVVAPAEEVMGILLGIAGRLIRG